MRIWKEFERIFLTYTCTPTALKNICFQLPRNWQCLELVDTVTINYLWSCSEGRHHRDISRSLRRRRGEQDSLASTNAWKSGAAGAALADVGAVFMCLLILGLQLFLPIFIHVYLEGGLWLSDCKECWHISASVVSHLYSFMLWSRSIVTHHACSRWLGSVMCSRYVEVLGVGLFGFVLFVLPGCCLCLQWSSLSVVIVCHYLVCVESTKQVVFTSLNLWQIHNNTLYYTARAGKNERQGVMR